MLKPVPPQRSTSMGLGGDTVEGHTLVTDSPHTSRMPLRAAGVPQPSYGGNGTSDHNAKGGSSRSFTSAAKAMATPELIRPSPGNPSRQSEPQTAMFNLLATIVGGGVLSLPYAIRKTGVVTGMILMAMAAVVGDFSLYMLCSCSRRTGKITYVQISKAAFGNAGGLFTTTILLVITIFVMIGYMVLVRDIWTGLVSVVVGENLNKAQSNQVLFAALVIVFPATLATDLHALRHFCYVGFFSVIVLALAIGYRSMEANRENPKASQALKLSADSWGDIMDAFPILSLSFMAHFNMLSVHSQFVNPTRERLKSLLHGTMGLTAALYIMLALCGYLYAFDNTKVKQMVSVKYQHTETALEKDDILLNFPPGDKVMILGRLGMGITMLVAVTMMVLPCREIMFEAGAAAAASVQGWCGRKDYLPVDGIQLTPGGTPRAVLNSCFHGVRHVVVTLLLMGFCLYFALAVPGVSVVWSICGSSVGFMISYLLPAVFYLKIRSHKAFNVRKAGAWAVIVGSSIMIVLCTTNAVSKALG